MGWLERGDAVETMKEMIQREIQTIDSLEERVAFKELMERVFLSLYETNRRMYGELEQRVQEELAYDRDRYQIKAGLIEKEYFDASHHFLSPMEESDVAEKHFDMKEILRAVREDGAFPLMKVMLCCDYLEIQKLWQEQPVFQGTIEPGPPGGEWKIEAALRENKSYLKKIRYLYQLFVRNGIPWQTANTPYLYKMADVIITKLPEEITGNEKISNITIQFGKYSRVVRKDLIPVWNIRRLELESIGFPTPCGDHKNYEHNISLRTYGSEHVYLVEDDRKIQGISQNGEKLRIISGEGEARKWSVYMLRSSEEHKIDRYTYPVMQNGRKGSFSEKYREKWNQPIRTKTELEHFIKSFCLEEYACYQGCQVAKQLPGRRETYSMNAFIADEIRDTKAQKKLILYFRPGQKEEWLQRDIMSFLVSEVQRLYPEYDCVGVLS